MKRISFSIIIVFFGINSWSQGRIPMLGETAPSFKAETTNGKINFPEDFGDSWKMLFSHPKDFTPVCTSEILQLAKMQNDFNDLGVKIAIISIDDVSTHQEWKRLMEDILSEGTNQVKIDFPLIADNSTQVSNKYGMLHAWENETRDVRGVFIIDPQNTIRSINFLPMDIGRNLEELKRIILALQTSEKDQVLIPANWEYGGDVLMKFDPFTDANLKDNPKLGDQYYKVGVNMWYKRAVSN